MTAIQGEYTSTRPFRSMEQIMTFFKFEMTLYLIHLDWIWLNVRRSRVDASYSSIEANSL
jgi:hypothetical protein